MTRCQDENCQCSGNSSGFVFGLILGAFIAGAILIMSSKDKDKIIKNIKEKLNEILKKINPDNISGSSSKFKTKKSNKISVSIPKNIDVLNLTPPPVSRKPAQKLFKKPKK